MNQRDRLFLVLILMIYWLFLVSNRLWPVTKDASVKDFVRVTSASESWSNPLFSKSPDYEWDAGGLDEFGNVVYDPQDTNPDKRYKALYTGRKNLFDKNSTYIGMLLSPDYSDGKSWSKSINNPLIQVPAKDPFLVKEKEEYFLYYVENSSNNSKKINVALSSDGVQFIPYENNPVLEIGHRGAWDSGKIASPVVWVEDGLWYMFYQGEERKSNRSDIGIAISEDGLTWDKYENNPLEMSPREGWAKMDIVPLL